MKELKILAIDSRPATRPNLPVAKCEGSPRTAMVGDVDAASIVAEGGVTVAVLMLTTSLTGIGVSGVNVLLTPKRRRKTYKRKFVNHADHQLTNG